MGMVETSVFPSPVFISETLPEWSVMAPNSWTSYGTISQGVSWPETRQEDPQILRHVSFTMAKASTMIKSRAPCSAFKISASRSCRSKSVWRDWAFSTRWLITNSFNSCVRVTRSSSVLEESVLYNWFILSKVGWSFSSPDQILYQKILLVSF